MADTNDTESPHFDGAPSHASLNRLCSGSITIEASVVLPLFLGLMVLAVFFTRILTVHSIVQQAMDEAVRISSSVWVKQLDDDNYLGEYASAGGVMLYAQKKLKDKGLDGFVIFLPEVDGEFVDLRAYYKMNFPIQFFGTKGLNIAQRSCSRKWIGDEGAKNKKDEKDTDDKYVYTTQYGKLYHENRYCKYIYHEPKNVAAACVKDARNQGGKKYDACLYCKPGDNPVGEVYITDWGDAYHKTLGCHHLNPDVSVELEEDAVERGLAKCSTCGKKE